MHAVEVGIEEGGYVDIPSALSDWYSEDAAGPASLVSVVAFFAEKGEHGLGRFITLGDAVILGIVAAVEFVLIISCCRGGPQQDHGVYIVDQLDGRI